MTAKLLNFFILLLLIISSIIFHVVVRITFVAYIVVVFQWENVVRILAFSHTSTTYRINIAISLAKVYFDTLAVPQTLSMDKESKDGYQES